MKKTKTIALISLCVIMLLAGCSKTAKKKETNKTEEKLTPVQVVSVQRGSIADSYKFGGTVTAKDSVAVLPDNTGKIKEILVRVGDYVEKGQVIGKVDPSRAGQNYNLSPVKAPISGTVTSISAVVGSAASPASPFAVIQTLDNLEISFSVIERYSTKVAEGNKVSVTFDAIENEVFDAHISQVNPTLDVATRTLSVKAKLNNDDSRLKAGMFARLNVITQEKSNAIVIPTSAVTINEDETFVFVVSGDVAQKVTVKTGIKTSDSIEIVEGLKDGDRLVTTGHGLLTNGQKVKVLN